MKFFAEENIPVVNVMSINKIIDGVLPPGAQKYEIGNGDFTPAIVDMWSILRG